MSAQRFKVHHIDLSTMQVTYLGEMDRDAALQHPEGWVFVVTDDGTYMRTDKEPVWQKISEGKANGFTVRSEGND